MGVGRRGTGEGVVFGNGVVLGGRRVRKEGVVTMMLTETGCKVPLPDVLHSRGWTPVSPLSPCSPRRPPRRCTSSRRTAAPTAPATG